MTCAGAGGSLRRVGGFVIRFGGDARAALPPDERPSSAGECAGGGVGLSCGAGSLGVATASEIESGRGGGLLGGPASGIDAGRGG
jgi:hypothetical protein